MSEIDLPPEEFRRFGYQIVDMLAEKLGSIPTEPARPLIPEATRDRLLHQPLPETAIPIETILQSIAEDLLPYPMGNASPRFFAWVNSPPAPLGILAEFIAAAHNPSVAGGNHSATYVEHAVLNWLKTIMHFPQESGALLTSGGSVANLVALAVMRHVKAANPIRAHGLQNQPQPMVVYESVQGHSCIQKAVELLGIGSQYLRQIPVDADFRMDVQALRQQIQQDRAAGLNPVCVAASAGTVNTGAIDPLDELADLCEAENLWLHVDGAYGGVGILGEGLEAAYKGIERANSLAIDPHKWLYVPIECGCTLVKDAQAMRDAFSLVPAYIRDDRELPWFAEFGIQQTRGFKALKLWMVMQQIGLEGYRTLINRDIALAKTLQQKINARDDFELIAAGPLSIVCFRYTPPDAPTSTDFDHLNRELLIWAQREGEIFTSGTVLNGQQVIRACIVNFRTTEADLDTLLDVLADAGQRVYRDLSN